MTLVVGVESVRVGSVERRGIGSFPLSISIYSISGTAITKP
jgi:hypothetical protein